MKYKDYINERSHMNKVWLMARLASVMLLLGSVIAAAAEVQPSPSGSDLDKKDPAVISEGPEISLRFPLMSPLFEDVPLALVNDDEVTLRQLTSALASAHEGKKSDAMKQAASVDFSEILKRLINVRLIVQEAREMGMDELTEVREAVEQNSKATVRELLIEDLGKDVKADEAEAEKLRREMVREWKIKSVLFEKEEDAKKMEEEIKAGKGFDELVAQAVADKRAKGQGEGGYVKLKDLLPDVASVVSTMEVGSVSPVIKVGSGEKAGFTVMKLEEIRYPDDPETLERAREAVLQVDRDEAVKNFKRKAYQDTVKVDKKLLKNLDFEAKKPGFEKMLKDKRTVATVKGEKPVTVADLAEALRGKFFHGMERPIRDKEVNAKKAEVLDGLLEKKLFEKEARSRGIEKTERFKARMKEYEDSLLFGLFVEKVMIPDVKASEEEQRAFYNDHIADYTTPEMVKVNGLAFQTLGLAEDALERLRKGADFNWMKSNAEGQVDKSAPGLLSFSGTSMVTKNLPEGVHMALSGAKPGEYRLYQSPEGHFYVLYVVAAVPPGQQPYEQVREQVASGIFQEKLNALVGDWAGKLRKAADVKIFLSSTAAAEGKAEKH
jgi:parvulin-like peptidyl-prolyl isomerase